MKRKISEMQDDVQKAKMMHMANKQLTTKNHQLKDEIKQLKEDHKKELDHELGRKCLQI